MDTNFTPFPTLVTNRLSLREIMIKDAPEILVHRSDERITLYTGGTKAHSLEDAQKFITEIQGYAKEGKSVLWAISLKGQEKLIGTICIWQIDLERSVAEVGFTLHPDFWGQGIASEALDAVINFGFEKLGAEVLEAAAHYDNIDSIRLLEKKGFLKTGEDEILVLFALCRPPLGSVVIQTERLLLREITPDDATFILELLNSPDWLKNIGDRNIRTVEDARNYLIYRIFLICRTKGFSFYVLQDKATNSKFGICGLIKRDYMQDVDIGYALLPAYFHKGYAIEAGRAVVDFAKQTLNLPRLAAIVIETNEPSIRLLEKLGMRFERRISVPQDNEELMLFGMELN